jgi:hypothetical protein
VWVYFHFMRPTLTATDLFASRGRVDALRVLWGVRAPLTAADVARRTRMTHPAASAVLRSLAGYRLVLTSPAGQGSTYWLNRESVYVDLILDPVFGAEMEIPGLMTDALREAFEQTARAAILFGSYARGDQDPESDVDVVVVTADPAAKRYLEDGLPSISATFSLTFGASLSAIVYDVDEARELAQRAPGLHDSLCREGLRVFGPAVEDWGDLESR